MNLVGKIFVVLVLVMALVFSAFSIAVYSTHTNWRNEILKPGGYRAQLEDARKQNQRLQDERNKFELRMIAERDAKIQALGKMEAEVNTLRTENETKTKQLQASELALQSSNQALGVAQTNLRNATQENEKLRAENIAARKQADDEIKRSIALQDENAVAKGQLTVLTERNQQLSSDVVKARQLLTAYGRKLEDPVDASTIAVSGAVSGVSQTRVELSVGADDGVRVGQELDIYRGDRYVGRVRITKADPDKAIGSILNEYMKLPIQKGDNVSSRL
jgi:hypothetical protein